MCKERVVSQNESNSLPKTFLENTRTLQPFVITKIIIRSNHCLEWLGFKKVNLKLI
jgi:hypothetical protein